MAKYITSYGDQIAVLSFCRQTKCVTDKQTLLQKLRSKIGARKMSSRKRRILSDTPGMFPEQGEGSFASPRSNATDKPCRKIELG